MQALLPSLMPVVAVVAIALLYYRRIRRQFGRQPWQAKRHGARLVLLTIVFLLLVASGFVLPHAALAIAGGILAGGVLGVVSIRLTQIESVDGLRWYTPNPWIGGALSLLLVARLVWRFGSGPLSGGTPAPQQASPLTLLFAATLVTFYLVSGGGLAWRMRALQPATS